MCAFFVGSINTGVYTDSSIGGGDGAECVWSSSSILGGELVMVVLVCTGKS